MWLRKNPKESIFSNAEVIFYYLDDMMQECSRVYISYGYAAVFLK